MNLKLTHNGEQQRYNNNVIQQESIYVHWTAAA